METAQARLHRIHDFVQVSEHLVPDVVLADVFPDVLRRIGFGTVGRQRNERHIGRDDEVVGFVPPGSIQEHEAVFVGKLGSGMGEKQSHQLCVDPGQDQGGHLPVLRAHGDEGVNVLADDLATDGGSQGQRSPAASTITDSPEAALVLKQEAQAGAWRELIGYGFDRFREFF